MPHDLFIAVEGTEAIVRMLLILERYELFQRLGGSVPKLRSTNT